METTENKQKYGKINGNNKSYLLMENNYEVKF